MRSFIILVLLSAILSAVSCDNENDRMNTDPSSLSLLSSSSSSSSSFSSDLNIKNNDFNIINNNSNNNNNNIDAGDVDVSDSNNDKVVIIDDNDNDVETSNNDVEIDNNDAETDNNDVETSNNDVETGDIDISDSDNDKVVIIDDNDNDVEADDNAAETGDHDGETDDDNILSRSSFLNADGTFCYKCFARRHAASRRSAESFRNREHQRLKAEQNLHAQAKRRTAGHQKGERRLIAQTRKTERLMVSDARRHRAQLAAHRAKSDATLRRSERNLNAFRNRLKNDKASEIRRQKREWRARMSKKCARRNCGNPKLCFNRFGASLPSGKAERAVRRGGRWYRHRTSKYYWSKCKWVRSRGKCHPTNPTLVRHGSVWMKKPFAQRRAFVRRNGVWWRSVASNEYYKNCAWIPKMVKRNCKDPTVRMVAGRWIRRSRTELKRYHRYGKQWYLGKRRRYVFKGCRWVKSPEYLAQLARRKLRGEKLRRHKLKVATKYAEKKWRRVLSNDFRTYQKMHPVSAAINKITYGDLHKMTVEDVPKVAAKLENRFTRFFMRNYLPKHPEANRPRPYRPKVVKTVRGVSNLNSESHGEDSMFVNEFDPEGNDNTEDTVGVARQSSFDLAPKRDQWTRDGYMPERGISGDYEPGAQARNAGKNADEMLHVVGEEEMRRNPVDANDRDFGDRNPAQDPSMARV